MSNFNFLKDDWRNMWRNAKRAESRIKTEPASTARYLRLVLEEAVHYIYKQEAIDLPYDDRLVNLLFQEDFKAVVPPNAYTGLDYVRKLANKASHYSRQKVKSDEALTATKYLFTFVRWFAEMYTMPLPPDNMPVHFDEGLVPTQSPAQQQAAEAQRQAQEEKEKFEEAKTALETELERVKQEAEALKQQAQQSNEALEAYKKQQANAKVAMQAQRAKRVAKNPTLANPASEFSEAETRQHYIDIALAEAGWDNLHKGKEIEFEVTGMPLATNPSGKGKADYVLWGDDAKPLAVVEAKKTSVNPENGRYQATLYADCLEQMFGQRPIIFYSNGFETYLLDDAFYSAPRRVYGFYTKDQLAWLIQQRSERQDIRPAKPKPHIVNRPYQIEAIGRIAHELVANGSQAPALRGGKRAALLVMATGSGKTRTAAALVDILANHGWAQRVLFLADRKALVRQAQKSFAEHLPDFTSINLVESAQEDQHARLVFSTYPTMMNKIDSPRQKGEAPLYSVGHFDLIIIDEAHRSVYNRYQAIFDYFDALLVGLTATPKASIDHNTYQLFGRADNDPTFAYELEEAVGHEYLVPYRNQDVSTEFLREGIRYHELSAREQATYEQTFADAVTGQVPDVIAAQNLNKWLFNQDTVNKVLDALMNQGLKIEGGDRLGRTIIFAANRKHAEFIVDCFVKRYPAMPPGFINFVHHGVTHAQSIIDKFCEEKQANLPQIVVSVDMMDTGIDAPRVLNLVFFKAVYSYAKFWQMIGRGTRLCPDLYGPGIHKDHFLIFDVCGNFAFFEVKQGGKPDPVSVPLAERLFTLRLQLSQQLLISGTPQHLELAQGLLDELHAQVTGLDEARFEVHMQRQWLDKFAQRTRWNNLSQDDLHQLNHHVAQLMTPEKTDEAARRFDALMLQWQLANLQVKAQTSYQGKVLNIASELGKKYGVPEVAAQRTLIEAMKDPNYYQGLDATGLEEIRQNIKYLVRFLDKQSRGVVYTNFRDSEASVEENEYSMNSTNNLGLYKKRVAKYIRENKHNLTIAKLQRNEPIGVGEIQALENILFDGNERGTRKEYAQAYGAQPLGTLIRSIVGLERAAAQAAFAQFVQTGNLNPDQINFIDRIINYLCQNGVIDEKKLFEHPFNTLHDQGVVGLFKEAEVKQIMGVLKQVNGNASVG